MNVIVPCNKHVFHRLGAIQVKTRQVYQTTELKTLTSSWTKPEKNLKKDQWALEVELITLQNLKVKREAHLDVH